MAIAHDELWSLREWGYVRYAAAVRTHSDQQALRVSWRSERYKYEEIPLYLCCSSPVACNSLPVCMSREHTELI